MLEGDFNQNEPMLPDIGSTSETIAEPIVFQIIPLYDFTRLFVVSYQSCPLIGLGGGVVLAKFSRRNIKFSFCISP
jgi:hypothetical protein